MLDNYYFICYSLIVMENTTQKITNYIVLAVILFFIYGAASVLVKII